MDNQKNDWRSSAELVDQGFEFIQQWMKKEAGIRGLDTGFADLNKILSGLQRGSVVMLGGRPAMGKTALMQNIALNVAEKGHGVGVFSMVDSAEQFMLRLISIKSKVPMSKIRNGQISKDKDFPQIADVCDKLYSLPIFVQDRSASVNTIFEKVRFLKKRQENLGLVIVDYIGALEPTSYSMTRSEAIAEASWRLKDLAKELDVCVLVLSQLNRSLEQRLDKRPILSDLRGSGALEQDADVICFIYRDEYYDEESPAKGVAEVIIAKQRNGPTGTVMLQFEGESLRFYDQGDDYLDGFI